MTGMKVAIVGCGRMGRTRWNAALELGAEVVVLVDPDISRAERLANGRSVQLLTSFEDISWDSINAVFVCTPPSERGPVELQAINNSIPLFLEKPIGLNADHCKTFVEALHQRRVVTAVGYMNRYRGSIEQVRQRLKGERVLGISANWVGRPYEVPWWGIESGSGGPVNEQATHLIDLGRYLVGEIAEVQAIGSPSATGGNGSETASINLRFLNGSIGSLLYSCSAEEKMIEFRLFTRRDEIRLKGWDFRLRDDPSMVYPGQKTKEDSVFTTEVAAFFEAIESGSLNGIRSDIFDAFQTQLVVDAVVRSIRTGTTEKVQ